ncbi:NAD(P)H-dependent flavin oxidoreductase [Geodermatophilus sp. SYSU D01176]
MTLQTRFTERFGVEHPVVSAPMDLVATAELATAVSRAGGLGLIGGGYGDEGWLRRQLAAAAGTRVGCGFITWSIDAGLLDVALSHEPAAVFLSFGDAGPYVEQIHRAGVPLICQVHDLAQVDEALRIGADAVCVQGGEAGGHGTGTRSTFTLVPETADLIAARRPEVLLLAAGGVADGRSLAAALALGADGVVVGTRFWATRQAAVSRAAHARALTVNGDATRRTSVYDIVRGKSWPPVYTGRVLANDFVVRWHGHEAELLEDLDAARAEFSHAVEADDVDLANMIVGEAVGQVHAIEDAGDVVRSMAAQAEDVLTGALRQRRPGT